MEHHFELTDTEFEAQFKACAISPDLFTHEAHLRLAWIHIKKYGEEAATNNICNQLYSYVTSLGAEDKYNHTVTVAAVKIVSHFMGKSKSENFRDFICEFPRLKSNFKELIGFHYTTDIFSSEKAKAEYLEPDKAPFK